MSKKEICPNCGKKMELLTTTTAVFDDGRVGVRFLCTKCQHKVFVDLKDFRGE